MRFAVADVDASALAKTASMDGEYTLRLLLSPARQRAFSWLGVADIPVRDPLLEERMQLVLTQMVLAQALWNLLHREDQPSDRHVTFSIPGMIQRAKVCLKLDDQMSLDDLSQIIHDWCQIEQLCLYFS